MNENQKKLFLILTIMTYTLSGICIPLSISEHFTGNMTLFNSTWASDCWQITFPILGFLLVDFSENETNPNKKKRLGWILLIGTILNFILAILLMSYDIKANEVPIRNKYCNIACYFRVVSLFMHFIPV